MTKNILAAVSRVESGVPLPSRWTILRDEIEEKGLLIAFLIPALAVLILAQGYPLLYSFVMSFQDFTLAKAPAEVGFVGLANFAAAANDEVFRNATRISLIFAIVATSVEIVLGLSLAYLVVGERGWNWGSRTILILPAVIAPIAVGTMWRMMLNSRAGLFAALLVPLGIEQPIWFANANTALLAVIGIDIWQQTPFVFLIYTAALASLPLDPIHAAQVDGASRWQIIRHIILPLLFPVTMIILMFRLIDSFMVLDIVYTTTYGGPGYATTTMSLWIYFQGLKYFNISYASAMSWILLAMTSTVALVLMAIRSRWLKVRMM